MKDTYRIVADSYAGYEVQVKRWYWPFWVQHGFSNTHRTLELAKKYLEGARQTVVYNDGDHGQ